LHAIQHQYFSIRSGLRDSSWNLITSSNLANLGASISANVAAGTYYLAISGIGLGDPLTTGYSDYASLGQYAISGTVVDPGLLKPPVAVISASPASGQAPLSVSFSSSGSTDDGIIASYSWNFGDGSAVSGDPYPAHTYTSAGAYKATLTVTDSEGLTGASSVTISVARDIYVDSIVMSSSSSSTAVSAAAAVTIKDLAGISIAGATVAGSWSGIVQGSSSGTTASSGTVSLSSPQSSASGTFTFTVTGVSAPGYTYNSVLNRKTADSISASLLPSSLPSVSITSPAANATVSGTVSVQVSASSRLD
jgi:PKD repeat protein